MNNGLLQIDDEPEAVDPIPLLRRRQTEVVKVIEAIELVASSDQWKSLKELVFNNLVASLEKRLRTECEKNTIDAPEIYRLNGQLLWARRYSDLYKLSEAYRVELENITKKLNDNA